MTNNDDGLAPIEALKEIIFKPINPTIFAEEFVVVLNKNIKITNNAQLQA